MLAFVLSMAVRATPSSRRLAPLLAVLLAVFGTGAGATPPERLPDVLVVTVDTLRADRLSAYGYRRDTSPAIDALLARGALFANARTPEPLTAPAMISMFTATAPDVHGATRNGIPMRHGLDSLGRQLARHGYRSAAFVANWTLRAKLSGLDEHFGDYREVLTRRRWLGLVRKEADAETLNGAVFRWADERLPAGRERDPWLIWVHYVDPHAPYQLHREQAALLGISAGSATRADAYDTEIRRVDTAIGRLLATLLADERLGPETLVVFAGDHGESLGEHGDWGHGRTLHEPALRVPLGVVWPGRIAPRVIDAAASLLDVTPTVLGLLGIENRPGRSATTGFDWTPVFDGAEPPRRRIWLQAHKGAAKPGGDAHEKRESGLLEIGVVEGSTKSVWRLRQGKLLTFDLATDADELHNLTPAAEAPTPLIADRLEIVTSRLGALGAIESPLDDESIAELRALGYLP